MGSAEIAEPLPAWVALPANDVAVKIRSGQGNTAFFQDLAAVLAAVQQVADSPSAAPYFFYTEFGAWCWCLVCRLCEKKDLPGGANLLLHRLYISRITGSIPNCNLP